MVTLLQIDKSGGDIFEKDYSSSHKKRKNRFRLRFHTAVIIKLIEKAIQNIKKDENLAIEICNDFDGHFHEIKDMIFKNISNKIPELKPEDIISSKFQKPSLIDQAGKSLRNKNKISEYNIIKLNIKELLKIIKKMIVTRAQRAESRIATQKTAKRQSALLSINQNKQSI